MRINAGKLDRRITIERDQGTFDTVGGRVPAWTSVASLPAQVIPLGGLETFRAGREAIVRAARFVVRYFANVTEADRISYDGNVWNITAISEINRREGLEIVAEVRK